MNAPKVEKQRLIKSIQGLEKVQKANNVSNSFDASNLNWEAFAYLIQGLIRPEIVNFEDETWKWVQEESPEIKASDILKLFRSVSNLQHNHFKNKSVFEFSRAFCAFGFTHI